VLLNSAVLEMVPTDRIGIRAVGNTIYAYHDSTIIITASDATYPDAGYLWALIDNTDAAIDNFGGGTLTEEEITIMTDALSSFGTLLKIGDGSTAEQFTTIAEVRDISGPALNLGTEEVTPQTAPGGWREHVPTLLSAGEVTFEVNFVPTEETHDPDTGLIALRRQRSAGPMMRTRCPAPRASRASTVRSAQPRSLASATYSASYVFAQPRASATSQAAAASPSGLTRSIGTT